MQAADRQRQATAGARRRVRLYLAPIPRSVQAPVRVLWRAADGTVIKTTRVP